MNPLKIGIIGTAGRNADFNKLSAEKFERMISTVIQIIESTGNRLNNIELVSGGAAWSDHVAVALCVKGFVNPNKLTIYAPTDFNSGQFVGTKSQMMATADIINYHHSRFSNKIQRNSLFDIQDCVYGNTNLVPGNGNFFDRNTKIAKSLSEEDILIAFTFGNSKLPQYSIPWEPTVFNKDTSSQLAGLKSGGTAHTWDTASCKKYHILLE